MKNDPVKELLLSAKEAGYQASLAWERWQRLLANAERVTARYGEAAPGGRGDARKDAVWQAEADAYERFCAASNAAAVVDATAYALIEQLPRTVHRAILNFRYLDGLDWEEVQEHLERINLYYSERQIFNVRESF